MQADFDQAGCPGDLKQTFNQIYAQAGPMEMQGAWMSWMQENCSNFAGGFDSTQGGDELSMIEGQL